MLGLPDGMQSGSLLAEVQPDISSDIMPSCSSIESVSAGALARQQAKQLPQPMLSLLAMPGLDQPSGMDLFSLFLTPFHHAGG